MKTELDRIIASAPAWIIGVHNKVVPGEKTQTHIDIEGREIPPDELSRLIEAIDQVQTENITVSVIWSNTPKMEKL